MADRDYIEIKESLTKMRDYLKKINEQGNVSRSNDAVPYTRQDDLYVSSVDAAKSQLGADFNEHETPMLYYPADGDVVLSGTISSLDNAKFQFRYKESDGCYLWVDGLRLTNDNVTKLSRINGFYKNWRKELEMSGDVTPISIKPSNV